MEHSYELWTVSIGGKIAGRDMTGTRWHSFKFDLHRNTLAYARDNGGDVVFQGEGTGYYQGSTEPSYTVLFTLPSGFYAAEYKSDLAILAKKYQQECIALTCGIAEFITSDWAS